MNDYTIEVTQIEDYQNISNTDALQIVFARAKSAVVNGARVILARKNTSGKPVKFDEIDTLEDLEKYKKQVFRYL